MRAVLLWVALVAPAAFAAPPTGSGIAEQTRDLSGRERQAALTQHLIDKHIPDFLTVLHPVQWTAADSEGKVHTVRIEVTRDYLAVGTNADFLRAPLDRISAVKVASAWQMVLPTSRMVDAIYNAATEKYAPRTMPPNDKMRSVPAYLAHRTRLGSQGANKPTKGLRAGHKKDVVVTPRLDSEPDQVAIYGWHRKKGDPIQPLSLWHGAGYTDYSHGIRLVAPTVQIDGVARDVFDVLADPVLSALLSDEGPWAGARAHLWPDEEPVYPPLE